MAGDTSASVAVVIEDDEDANAVFSLVLTKMGFKTTSILDGAEALQYLKTADPAPIVVILDLHLPGVSGEQILAFVRSDMHLKQIAVIVATADPELAEKVRPNAHAVLVKPVVFTVLQEAVSECCPDGSIG